MQPFANISKIGVLKTFAIFTGRDPCWSLNCFPVNIAKFLRTDSFIQPLRWLLLDMLLLNVKEYDSEAATGGVL